MNEINQISLNQDPDLCCLSMAYLNNHRKYLVQNISMLQDELRGVDNAILAKQFAQDFTNVKIGQVSITVVKNT